MNEAIMKIDGGIKAGLKWAKKFYNSPAAATGKAVAHSVASDMKTGSFAMHAALYGGAGGAAGYAYDGRDGAMKGAGLGVLGAAVHRNWKNPTIRAAGRDMRGFAGSKYRSGMARWENRVEEARKATSVYGPRDGY